MIFYIFVVTLINSTCTVPFLPAYAVCMRTNFKEALIDWHNGKLLIIIPFTIIVATNILFDYDDIQIVTPPRLYDINTIDHPEPILSEKPLKTSFISGLFIVLVFLILAKLQDFIHFAVVSLLIISLAKGPLIVIWTNHQLRQKSLKKKQLTMEEVEMSLSAKPQFSQLESHDANEL